MDKLNFEEYGESENRPLTRLKIHKYLIYLWTRK